MKVKDMIALLKKVDPNHEVVMSKDAEGNSFSPFSDFSHSHYCPDSTWDGWLWNEEDHEEEGDEKPRNAVPCIVLWPIN